MYDYSVGNESKDENDHRRESFISMLVEYPNAVRSKRSDSVTHGKVEYFVGRDHVTINVTENGILRGIKTDRLEKFCNLSLGDIAVINGRVEFMLMERAEVVVNTRNELSEIIDWNENDQSI